MTTQSIERLSDALAAYRLARPKPTIYKSSRSGIWSAIDASTSTRGPYAYGGRVVRLRNYQNATLLKAHIKSGIIVDQYVNDEAYAKLAQSIKDKGFQALLELGDNKVKTEHVETMGKLLKSEAPYTLINEINGLALIDANFKTLLHTLTGPCGITN
jgi:hypothetical protein